jgi:hypothetical protein
LHYLLALSEVYREGRAVADVSDRIGPNGAREMSDAAGAANSYSLPPQDRFAAELRGFGPLGILAVLVIVAGQIVAPLGALLVLVWTRLSRAKRITPYT